MSCAECCRRFRTRSIPGKPRSIGRDSLALSRSELAADPQHDSVGVVAPLAETPELHLLGEVACRLPAQRRIAGADAFAGIAVALGAGLQTASRIAPVIETVGSNG